MILTLIQKKLKNNQKNQSNFASSLVCRVCDMKSLSKIAKKYNIPIVEDAAMQLQQKKEMNMLENLETLVVSAYTH